MELTLPRNLQERLDEMAGYREMTPQQVIEEALSDFFTQTDILAREVAEAEGEADRNGWLTHEEVLFRLKYLHREPA